MIHTLLSVEPFTGPYSLYDDQLRSGLIAIYSKKFLCRGMRDAPMYGTTGVILALHLFTMTGFLNCKTNIRLQKGGKYLHSKRHQDDR